MNNKSLERTLRSYANEIKRNINNDKIYCAFDIMNIRDNFCKRKLQMNIKNKINLSNNDKKVLYNIISVDKHIERDASR